MYSKEDIQLLLGILLESEHFEITEFSSSRFKVCLKSYGDASRCEDGVHGFAFKSFIKLFSSFVEHDSRFLHEYLIPVEEEKYDSLAKMAIAHYLISLQNQLYYEEHGKLHPISGKGTTYHSNLTRPLSELLPDCNLFLERNEQGIVRINIGNEKLMQMFLQEFCNSVTKEVDAVVPYKVTQDAVFLSPNNFTNLLKQLRAKRINYQGIIPVTKDGEILMAQRKDYFSIDAQGYATCGGHNSDPYHKVALAPDLLDEFNISLKPDAGLEEFYLLTRKGDLAVYFIREDAFEIAEFKPNKKEFLEKSGESFSFAKMRKRKLVLRNIDSLEYYLDYCQEQLYQQIIKKFPDTEVLVNVDKTTKIDKKANLRFVCDDFGKVEFACRDEVSFEKLLELFEKELKEFIEVDTKNFKIVFSILNPQQLIDFFDGKLSKKELIEYVELQKEKDLQNAAASKIQKWIRPKLARIAVLKGDAQIDIKEKSQENLQKLRADLRDGKFLDYEEKSKKDPQEILTNQEQILFESLKALPLFLLHCSGLKNITNLKQFGLLSYTELKHRGFAGGVSEETQDESLGIARQIFFAIGSKTKVSNFLSLERPISVRVNFDNILRSSQHEDSWGGEDWFFYFYPPEESHSKVEIGDHDYRVVYDDEELEKRHVVNKKKTVHWDCRKLGEDVFCAKDAKEFLALMFIYRLRFIGGSAREYLLKNPTDEKAIAMVFNDLFSNYNLEYHLLAKLDLTNEFLETKIFDVREAIKIAEKLEEAVKVKSIESLLSLKAEHEDLAYQYKLSSKFRGFTFDIGLLICRSNSYEIAKFFIDNGFFDEITTSYKLQGESSKLMKGFVEVFDRFTDDNNAKKAFLEAGIVNDEILCCFKKPPASHFKLSIKSSKFVKPVIDASLGQA